jgi:para-aminobenzoate synthetase component 1
MYFSEIYTIAPESLQSWIDQSIQWAKNYPYFCFFNSGKYTNQYGNFGDFLAVDAVELFHHQNTAWNQLNTLKSSWYVGYLSYNLKNYFENVHSAKPNQIDCYDFLFFKPQFLIHFLDDTHLKIETYGENNTQKVWDEIRKTIVKEEEKKALGIGNVKLSSNVNFQAYQEKIVEIKSLISEGEVYELNYCISFDTKVSNIETSHLFKILNRLSPNPYACYFQSPEIAVMSASPERYIRKNGQKIISQPIKGTIARGATEEQDKKNKSLLFNNPKDRAENLMIVDLVRSDMAKVSDIGSVKVDELYGIYSFPQVHQMISSISADLKKNLTIFDAISSTFPMGSMTGAPKISAMNYIDDMEKANRGIFSGSIGWLNPNGDADFNVLIRSFFYDHHTQKLSFYVGSAITIDSDPQQEYEECMLKAKAMLGAIEQLK